MKPERARKIAIMLRDLAREIKTSSVFMDEFLKENCDDDPAFIAVKSCRLKGLASMVQGWACEIDRECGK